ncbi:ultraviolet-B receptor UVR8-like [Ipomoea triloba]|uniref:ultraviolet-B receptor UVR8-like n=1 Tax=Ipomoea triloba TaxID=35885 RepID=UPI00125E92FE|nr:ultraviolet-B receptor UVR8-like [Ipomoea triloba]
MLARYPFGNTYYSVGEKGVPVKMVAAGAEHTAAVTEDGELYGWGWGRYGNLGLGDRNDRLVPEKVSAIQGEKMVMVAFYVFLL